MSSQSEPQPDLETRALIERTLKECRRQIVEQGEVMAAAMLVHDHEVEVVPLTFQSPADKDRIAFMIRELVKLHQAETVLLVGEVWTLPESLTPAQVQALRQRYQRIQDMPGRIEAVHVSVELRAGGLWSAIAPIVRQGRSVRLGTPSYRELGGADVQVVGRMAGFFAPPRPVPADLSDLSGLAP